jgi:hypothetical protein
MRVGAGVIILLMLLSGAAVFIASQSTPADPNSPDPTAPNVETYIAQDVTGKVTLVLPSAIIGGNTTQTDKSVIDEALGLLPGVISIESRYTELTPGSNELTYLANVQLSSIEDKEAFAAAIPSLTILTNPEVYFQASVTVPQKLSGINQANESKDITLTKTTIQAIVSPQTQEGHDISGAVSISFQGETIVSAYMLESQNVSLTPQSITITENFTLAGLQDTYSIAGTWTYLPSYDAQSMKEDLEDISLVESVNDPIIPYIDNLISLTFTDANTYVDDINAYALLHPNEFSSVTGFGNTLYVELGVISLAQAKSDLQSAIESAAATNVEIVFQEPLTQFLVDVNISSSNAESGQVALKEYFSSLDANVDIYQNGHIEMESITNPDTNDSYAVPDSFVPVVVKPGHVIGDSILFQVSAIAQDGILSYINGVEMTPLDTNSTA